MTYKLFVLLLLHFSHEALTFPQIVFSGDKLTAKAVQKVEPTTQNAEIIKQRRAKLYIDNLEKCAKEFQLPIYNKALEEYQCFGIFQQGPCNPGQWVALDPRVKAVSFARCFDVPCNGSKDFVPFGSAGECKVLKDPSPCGPGAHLLRNPYGQGNNLIST